MKTREDIKRLIEFIGIIRTSAITNRPGYSYEQGILDTIKWVYENECPYKEVYLPLMGYPWDDVKNG